MIHLPFCLLAVANPSMYKLEARPFVALLLKAVRMRDAAAAAAAALVAV